MIKNSLVHDDSELEIKQNVAWRRKQEAYVISEAVG